MARTWWQPWTWRKPRRLNDVHVVVYTRLNCHLCEEAGAFLDAERQRLGFQLEWIDVDQNDELRALHGDWVPVVEVNGEVRFRGRINEVLWQRLVQALGKRE